MGEHRQAGWYPDPHDPGHVRWWNGNAWTEHVAGRTSAPSLAVEREASAPPPLSAPAGGGPRSYRRLLGASGAVAAVAVAAVAATLAFGGGSSSASAPDVTQWRALAQVAVCKDQRYSRPGSSVATQLNSLEWVAGQVSYVPAPRERPAAVFGFYDAMSRMAESVRRARREATPTGQRLPAAVNAARARAERAARAAGVDLTPDAARCASALSGRSPATSGQ